MMRNTLALLLLAGTIGANGQSLTDSLIAHFPMDGSPDEQIGGLSPTVTSGTPSFCPDRFGNPDAAACFDGASFWSYGDTLDMDTADFSIACWLFVDSVQEPFEVEPNFWTYGGLPIVKGLTQLGDPVRAGYGLSAREAQSGSYILQWVTGDSNDNTMATTHGGLLDVWQHMVLTRYGTHQVLYIDGQIVADSVTAAARNLNTNIFFTFGALNRDPTVYVDTEHFIGALDDVRIYKNRCLSQGEIDTLAFDLLTVGGNALEGEPLMVISPNPASDLVRIQLDRPIGLLGSFEVFDAMGRKHALTGSGLAVQSTGVSELGFRVADLAPGAYCIRLWGEQRQLQGWFIKE